MMEEEIARLAMVLKECGGIRAMIAQEDASSNGGGDGIPIAAAPTEEEKPIPVMAIAT
jgi:hypothetical protein